MKFSLENLHDFRQLIKHLSAGLRRLTLEDNFEGEQIQALIPSGQELRLRNPLNFIPTRYIIVSKSGNSTISRSGTWTSDYIYFTNYGTDDSQTSIQLLR